MVTLNEINLQDMETHHLATKTILHKDPTRVTQVPSRTIPNALAHVKPAER